MDGLRPTAKLALPTRGSHLCRSPRVLCPQKSTHQRAVMLR
jgi:hypothetical protein